MARLRHGHGYSVNKTLPPKQDVDVCKFLAIFKNPGAAANYVGYVKWACTHLSMVTSWWSPTVTLTLKGMRAEHLRTTGGPALAKVLLTDEWVAQLARLSLAMNQPHLHAVVLVSSVFLLRVQSEAMGLEVGMKRDAQTLPPGRHRAVWIESCEGGLDSLHIRLARRKHRPQGSLLVRTCACAGASPHCCTVHAVAQLLRNKHAGATLFDLTSSSFLKAVRRMLTLLGHMDANKCTLKAFRAGRATSLAAAGSPTGVILAAGEWKSFAFFRYCQTDEISVSAVLEVVCAEDELVESRRIQMGKSAGGTDMQSAASVGTSVGCHGEQVVLRDHGGCSGSLYSFGTGGITACYQCGVASAQCGGIGSPGAVVPLCQVTLLASFSPSLYHAHHGSLVTPSVCCWTPFCVSPYPRA